MNDENDVVMPRCVRVDPDLGTVQECEKLRGQVIRLKLVANVLEVKGGVAAHG